MIPVSHGRPALGLLVPRARLWRNWSGTGWSGQYGVGWRLHLLKDRTSREWTLFLKGPTTAGWDRVCELAVRRGPEESFLHGRWELEEIVVKRNPPEGQGRKTLPKLRGELTVYSCVTGPRGKNAA